MYLLEVGVYWTELHASSDVLTLGLGWLAGWGAAWAYCRALHHHRSHSHHHHFWGGRERRGRG